MKITEKEISEIIESIKQNYRCMNWSEEDITIAINWIIKLHLLLGYLEFPIFHKNFPEVLRAYANMLDICIRKDNK